MERLGDITYLAACRQALIDELDADPNVLLLGQDIGAYGGAFKVTEGLLERFGAGRVIDTPITEAGTVGAAIGAALMGMRPVVEMQFMDFISNAFNMITNFAATCHYRLGWTCPLVIRGPYGGGVGAGPFHSQCPEGYFAHCPGLKIITPATVEDAYIMMRWAIRDPNPVIVLEHKGLYRRLKGSIDVHRSGGLTTASAPSPEEGSVLRRGSVLKDDDIVIVAYGAMVQVALEVSDALRREGIGASVIDCRRILPLDMAPIVEAVKRCGRLVIAHEGRKHGGIGADISAQITEMAFEYLDAPPQRVAALDVPVPYSGPMESEVLPNAGDLMDAARAVLMY